MLAARWYAGIIIEKDSRSKAPDCLLLFYIPYLSYLILGMLLPNIYDCRPIYSIVALRHTKVI